VINERPHQIQNYANIKQVFLVLGFFMFLSAVSPRYLLILDHSGYWEASERRMKVLVRNLRAMTVAYQINVSNSSGTGSPELFQINGH